MPHVTQTADDFESIQSDQARYLAVSVMLFENLSQTTNNTSAMNPIFSNACGVKPCQIIIAIVSPKKITPNTIIEIRLETLTLQNMAPTIAMMNKTIAISITLPFFNDALKISA